MMRYINQRTLLILVFMPYLHIFGVHSLYTDSAVSQMNIRMF